MKTKKINLAIIILLIGFILTACDPHWQIQLITADQPVGQIDQEDVTFYIEKSLEEVEMIPLGQLFYQNSFTLIDQIELTSKSGESQTFTWDEIAEKTTISKTGQILIDDQQYEPVSILISPSNLIDENVYSIMDIAPTIAFALGLPPLPNAMGNVRLTYAGEWDRAVMILLDGLQYEKLQNLIDTGDLPFLQKLDMLQRGLTVYPPITTSSTASLLTGAPPDKTGVFGYGYRSTELTTLFDLAAENGMRIIAIEGNSLPFNLRNAETNLSGDQDGNGFSNDNVFLNSLAVIHSDLPDILYIHFHEIDDLGHEYGPDLEEYTSAIIRVDRYLSEIYDALPEATFIVIFADHGMHGTSDGGNHGTLTAADLTIPIIFLEK